MRYSKDDIDNELAVRAFSGTSYTPEQRAYIVVAEYESDMARMVNTLLKFKTDDNGDDLETDFEAYKAGYLSRLNAWLQARSRLMSPFITGPSNFPTEKQGSIGELAERRLTELLEWQKKTIRKIENKYKPCEDTPEKLTARIARLEEMLALSKAINKITRKKTGDKAAELRALGLKETTIEKLLDPEFTSFDLANDRAMLKRLQAKLAREGV